MLGAIFFERIPRPLLGRVSALADATAWAAMPFGGLLAAAVIALVGLSPTFVILGIGYALATLIPAFGSAGRSFDPPAEDRAAELVSVGGRATGDSSPDRMRHPARS